MRTDIDVEESPQVGYGCFDTQEMGHMIEALHEVEADFENLSAATAMREPDSGPSQSAP